MTIIQEHAFQAAVDFYTADLVYFYKALLVYTHITDWSLTKSSTEKHLSLTIPI